MHIKEMRNDGLIFISRIPINLNKDGADTSFMSITSKN
ncbi:MAG: hypothetical protein ACI9XU_001256 [Arenicella sp.]|jgi:hypothetical protein